FIEEELLMLRSRQQALHDRLEDLLLAEGEDFGSIIMEIRAGTGGDEAAIFAGDLYRMYTQYARDKGWKVEEISFGPGEQGGYKGGTSEEMEVKCQDERTHHKNYDRALRILRSRLYERQQQSLHDKRAEARRTLIGSGDRSERIRTYNYPQNRLTDHRINLTLYKLDAIFAGSMDEVIQALKDFDKKQRLEGQK